MDQTLAVAKKVAGFIGKAAQSISGAVGGVISRAGDMFGGFANKASGVLDKTDGLLQGPRASLDHHLCNNSLLNGLQPILK